MSKTNDPTAGLYSAEDKAFLQQLAGKGGKDKPARQQIESPPKKEAVKQDAVTQLATFNRHFLAGEDADEQGGSSLWLITFADIMALMLTFFVLLYSMAVPDEEKWEGMTTALNQGFSKLQSPKDYAGPQDTIEIEKLDLTQALNIHYLQEILKQIIAGDERLANVVLIPQTDRLIISLPEDLLFEPGDDDVGTRGKRALFALGGKLAKIRNRIEVVGHADPRPVSNEKFSTNWQLSLARAAQVSNILMQFGYRRDITVRGVSSARYDELPEGMDEQRRLDLSRRVDIVIMQDDGNTRSVFGFGGL
ncbi:MAG: OmpA/MotB family protein [Bdellovibrionales bacterium]